MRLPLPRRDLALLAVGILLGAGVTAVGFIVTDDDPTSPVAGGPATTVTTVDITDTDFGELTEEAEADGIKVQWTAEILSGPETGQVEFVSAHRDGEVAVISGDQRAVVKGDEGFACDGDDCRAVAPEEAAAALPPLVRPFFQVLRVAAPAQESPDYRITGEGDFGGGVVARCGSYPPAAFSLELPGDVQEVRQCVSLDNGILVAIDLFGTNGSVAGAAASGLADASTSDFETG
ncbi:MAG TPA: hypothetical protein VM618_10350 [Acidimicrobiia bacterium]|nr:hypothetical protein [Acidimicrobiia bacterium]